jgi:hypothetical protein
MYEESGRPRGNRVIAGEGMLVATVDGEFTDPFGRHKIMAGITRIAVDHPLARRRPEAFRVCWRRDVETATRHRDNLRARMAELRGKEQAPQVTAGERPDWYIG